MHAVSALRVATPGDAAEIARLSTQLGYPADAATMADRLTRWMPRADHFIRVVADGPRLLGWIAAERRLTLETGDSFEIVGLVVDQAAHRGGIGSTLVAAVADWARAHGGSRLVVRSNIVRTESHPFYERQGFTRVKSQHVYRRDL
ncbi:GNAT family N-acetyltransferase [Pseudoxanthomonas beigongshangi]